MEQEDEMQYVTALKVQDQDLLTLNRVVNNAAGLELGITIFSHGRIISGLLTSGKDFYSTTAEKLKAVGALGESLAIYFDGKANQMYTYDESEGEIPNNFLHLKKVSVMSDNGSRLDMKNAMLRIKIEEIEGYVLGNTD
ncbi:gas vesicle protein [Citrobacter amalonaticus]|uniref:gas vesicle protein n=1 Tax=Citrobacter amalonaticus TaxID=35703 RepID=UPI00281A4DC4|nr:gas vesicle protein [Citrobacter amalonaticus]HCB3268678.1 gas vesicle protein [Citrobacter amalonaticus]